MSNFIVSARKYRPARFSDVVGQAHISQTLKNALKTGQIAHAFLFCGPRGVGKTTNARILAKILNCTNRTDDFEACNECNSCTAFNENASFNIFELDAASNNGVEHIKSLIEQVRFAPQQGKYKVFIIDEVHMLSSAAFNAFLKTLEEPPAHAIFILATTEKHKIIPTILSRCQIFDFRRIQIGDIVDQLQKICKAELIEAQGDALHVIAQKADGSMRDALSIFDRIAGATDKKISYQDVVDNLNLLDYDYFFRTTDAAMEENGAEVFNILDQVIRNGFEPELFIDGLSEHLRNLLVCKDPATLALLETGEELRSRYRLQSQLAPVAFLLTALQIANECDIHFKTARNKRIHTEIALSKMVYISRALDGAGLSSKVLDTPLPSVEKKNPDLRKEAKTSPKEPVSAPVQKPASYISPSDSTFDLSKEPKPGPALPSKVAKSATMTFAPKIGSISEITAMIEREEELLSQVVSRLDFKNLADSWKKYAETVESPSLKLALLNASLSLDGLKVVAKTGSELAVGMMQTEQNLITFLRFDLSAPELSLQIWFDEFLAPDEVKSAPLKKYLSAREKLQMMMEVNPLVKEFAIKFGLKPEE